MSLTPAQLGSSNPIDREGTGVTPVAGSTFHLIDSIPRGPARLDDAMRSGSWRYISDGKLRYNSAWRYRGGKPRCPICLSHKNSLISFSGANIPSDFHCRKCLVYWVDSDDAQCYVCGDIFRTKPPHHDAMFVRGTTREGLGVCYHLNSIDYPFCDRCALAIGSDTNHCRRELRRRVGLR